jgi:hypothetical protein
MEVSKAEVDRVLTQQDARLGLDWASVWRASLSTARSGDDL